MRRAAAALATAVLTTLALSGPLAAPVRSAPAPAITCGAGATSPECVLLDKLAAQLGPLQSILGLAGPAMAELAPGVAGLAALADQAGGVPRAEVAGQVQALLDQLDVLPAGVRSLLATAKLDGLITTLEALLAEVTKPLVSPTTGEASGPATPATTDRAAPAGPAAATSSAPPTLGGSLTGPGGVGSTTSSSPIPDVPVGDSLTLAPLALPNFGFSDTIGLEEEASAPEVEQAPVSLEEAAATSLPDGGSGTQVGVVIVLSLLLIGGAFAAQAHQNRHTIPD